MPQGYLPIFLFLIIAIAFPVVTLMAAKLIRPSSPSKLKLEAYECGIETVGDAWVQFKVQCYLYALIFVVFDIETVFLFPWAAAYNQLGLDAFFEMLLFVALLGVALVYAWRKGALEWA